MNFRVSRTHSSSFGRDVENSGHVVFGEREALDFLNDCLRQMPLQVGPYKTGLQDFLTVVEHQSREILMGCQKGPGLQEEAFRSLLQRRGPIYV